MKSRFRGAQTGAFRLARATVARLACIGLGTIGAAKAASAGDADSNGMWTVTAAVAAVTAGFLIVFLAAMRQRTRTQLLEMVRLATEHSRAEQERNHLFAQTAVLLFIGDLEGRPLQANLAWYRALGYLPEELDLEQIAAILHPDDLETARVAARELASHGGDKRFETRMRASDGQLRWFSWTLTILPGGDRLLGVGRDITEIREASEQASAKNRELFDALGAARAAMDEKSRFLAATGHEIRNPLHAILGMTELLLTTRLTPEQREYAQTVRDSSESLVVLLNDLLDYSRMEARGIEVHRAPYRPRDMAQGVLHLMTPKAIQKGLRIEIHVDEQLPETVIGDAGRMRQVLMNLVGNAIRFTDLGSVRIALNMAAGASGEDTIRVAVADTGIGIADSDTEAIFQPFLQLPAAGRRGGSGLGLSISRQLVEAMGGVIGVDSEVGKGSTFWFEVAAPGTRCAGRNREHNRAEDRCRVLVVEDNLVNQTLTRRLLEKEGYRVDVANNGVEALAAAASSADYDLIFMDIQMPEMDGLEATRAIRRLEEERPLPMKIPIVALTASVITDDLRGCLAAGMDDYLSKPFTPDALRDKVDRWVRQKSAAAVSGA